MNIKLRFFSVLILLGLLFGAIIPSSRAESVSDETPSGQSSIPSEAEAEWLLEHESDGSQISQSKSKAASVKLVLSAIGVLVAGGVLVTFASRDGVQISTSCANAE